MGTADQSAADNVEDMTSSDMFCAKWIAGGANYGMAFTSTPLSIYGAAENPELVTALIK